MISEITLDLDIAITTTAPATGTGIGIEGSVTAIEGIEGTEAEDTIGLADTRPSTDAKTVGRCKTVSASRTAATETRPVLLIEADLLIKKSIARCSGDHLALDRVEVDQLCATDDASVDRTEHYCPSTGRWAPLPVKTLRL